MKTKKLPRKTKKKFKKIPIYFKDENNDYILKNFSDFATASILKKLKENGIKPEDIEYINKINGQLNITTKLIPSNQMIKWGNNESSHAQKGK